MANNIENLTNKSAIYNHIIEGKTVCIYSSDMKQYAEKNTCKKLYECKKVNAIINQYFQKSKQTFLSN